MKPKSRLVVAAIAPWREDHARADGRVADELHAVAQCEREVEDRPEPPAEEAGHEEQQRDAESTVAVGGDAELQADDRREHDQRACHRMRQDDPAVAMPTKAPTTVGTMVSASSR